MRSGTALHEGYPCLSEMVTPSSKSHNKETMTHPGNPKMQPQWMSNDIYGWEHSL